MTFAPCCLCSAALVWETTLPACVPSLFSRVQLFATLGVDAQSEAGSACILHSLSSKLLSCCRAYSPVSCPETEHKGAFTCLHSAPHSAGKCQSGWAPVIGTGSLGPLSPQRSHYHVIGSRGDTVCMESLGRLQWGQILPPVLVPLTHTWGLVTTPGSYWEGPHGQLSRGQGEFSEFPVGEPKFTVKVIAGGGTLRALGLPSLCLLLGIFPHGLKCVLSDHQHGVWRLGFLLSWSSIALSIYGLRSV